MPILFTTVFSAVQRRLLLFVGHLGLAALSNWVAFLLRFDGNIPAQEWDLLVAMLPLLLIIRAFTFYPFRLYDGIWRYTGLWTSVILR
jgi:FlaA1/EpsC-like NDP-sugar epimerase